MDILVNGIGYVVGLFGVDTSFVGALPTALMKSLSGSGANGLMIDTMKQYGADSFVGRMSCVARGASDTTFYILVCVFRQRRYHQNEECRDVWADCRFFRHHCSHHHQLLILLLKELA